MRKLIWLTAIFLLPAAALLRAQELFVFSEPASNMPAHSMGIRVNNQLMWDHNEQRINYHFIPELMWGVNKNLMLHAEGFVSNRNRKMNAEGLGLYGKYRFYSRDNIYRHFRMAAFGRISTNNGEIHQEEIESNGHNSGVELGMIGTQLLHRLAISGTVSYERAVNNSAGHDFPAALSANAINYSLSAGQLLLPKNYKGYKQVNLNVMIECPGQVLMDNGRSFLDLAVAAQLIFNSQARLDVGYKHQLYSTLQRSAPNGFMIRLEYLLFNVL